MITSAENTAVECLSFVDLYALLGPDATGVTNWADASAAADEYRRDGHRPRRRATPRTPTPS